MKIYIIYEKFISSKIGICILNLFKFNKKQLFYYLSPKYTFFICSKNESQVPKYWRFQFKLLSKILKYDYLTCNKKGPSVMEVKL